jgi:hypothetical protein
MRTRKELPMYGTLVRIRPKPGQETTIDALNRRWLQERAPRVPGFIAEYLLASESTPGELVGLVLFDSESNYRKNADDPEQDRWYRELRAALDADPEWNDGEIVALEPATVPF